MLLFRAKDDFKRALKKDVDGLWRLSCCYDPDTHRTVRLRKGQSYPVYDERIGGYGLSYRVIVTDENGWPIIWQMGWWTLEKLFEIDRDLSNSANSSDRYRRKL